LKVAVFRLLDVDFSSVDASVELGFAVLGAPFLAVISSIIGSVAHTHPTFAFNELLITNYFGTPRKLGEAIAMSIVQQVRSVRRAHVRLR
jgi:hypothetical protein